MALQGRATASADTDTVAAPTNRAAASADLARRLTAARAILDIEDAVGRAWDPSIYETPVTALNTARAYVEIGDYENALHWYRLLQQSSDPEAHRDSLAGEMFSAAVMSGDSLQVVEQLLNIVGTNDLASRESAVALAYRHYLGNGDATNLGLLLEKTAAQEDRLSPRLRFWQCFALESRGEHEQALGLLLDLVADKTAADPLTTWQLGWVLRATPDISFLLGRDHDAARLYGILAGAAETGAGRWACYQLANLTLQTGDYTKAAELFRSAGGDGAGQPWQASAVAMADAADKLAEIRKEGARHGGDR